MNITEHEAAARPVTKVLLPFVSVVMPVLNEEHYIGQILSAVLSQDYPQFEVIIADGGSTDRTREIVRGLQDTHPNLRLIDNPGRIVSTGLNRAIRCAQGDIIVRLDGHCEYPKDYVRRVVELRERLGADNVGGVLVPIGQSYVQKAVALAYGSPVALGGGVALKAASESETVREVDAVHGGCWKRERLLEVQGFDEAMVRNQDDELSFRLRKQHGRIYQSATLRVKYHVRSSYRKLLLQFAQYGYWKVDVVRKHPQQASLRHFIPGAFVLALLALAVGALYSTVALWTLIAMAASYLLVIGTASLIQVWREGKGLLPGVIAALACMHLGYGWGFIFGCLRAAFGPLPTDRFFQRISR